MSNESAETRGRDSPRFNFRDDADQKARRPYYLRGVPNDLCSSIVRATREERPDVATIARAIESDRRLRDAVLGLTNSASHALRKRIVSVAQAVVLLGTVRLGQFLGGPADHPEDPSAGES